MKEWYVIKTLYNKERAAVLNLKNQKFKTYLPTYKKFIKRGRKLSSVIKPLFPGYLFVNIDIDSERWVNINSTYGVKNIIVMGLLPVPISKEIINDIKDREDENGVTDIIENISLNKGDNVRVYSGVLEGKKGIFDGFTADKRIRILFEFLGRNTLVSLPAVNVIRD